MSTETDPTLNWSFETKQIHAGQSPDAATNARALPIYQTTSYTFNSTDHAAALFGLAEPGNIYTRIMNPTTDVVEQRIAALEGGVAALFLASGQAAETFAILNLAAAGDHIVSSPRLYGGTYNLFHYTLPKLGIEVSFVENPDDLDSWRAAIKSNTKAFFAETISNPQIDILDTPGVSGVAHEQGIPLIVDNTIATPYLIQPISQGADIVVHSATKYLGGHGSAIAGVIVDSGTFDWTSGRFPGFTTPDPSYHGVVYAELGPPAYALKARVQLLRDLGSAASPFNAFLVAQGLETLSLRVERHVANAQRVAEFLEARDEVLSVNYAGLASSPWHGLAKKLAPKGTGAVLAFELAGGIAAGKAFVDALTLHSHVANIGDVRSLVIHPASTTHAQLTPDEQVTTGVTPGLVRLAVGIEGIDDILADLEQGFAAAGTIGAADPRAVAAFLSEECPLTISPELIATLPAEGELGVIDIGPLTLESGAVLDDVSIAVQRWGELSPTRDNVVMVLHALTGDSHITGPAGPGHPTPGWWDGVAGPGAPIDTDRWCAISTNVLGGCRGSTGPGSLARDGRPWGSRFPVISVRDQVNADVAALAALGISEVAAVVGGSMGGARALEWAVSQPDSVRAALILAVGARATADQIGTQCSQVAAIKADPDWQSGDYHGTGRTPETGLQIARRFAHLTYRGEVELDTRFANDAQGNEDPLAGGRYAVQSYLEHQGGKLLARFDAGSYVALSDALSNHDVGRGRGGVAAALRSCPVPAVVGGITSDRLYPLRLQQEIADLLPGCTGLEVVDSIYGHDGFLVESEAVGQLVRRTLELAAQ